MNNLLISIVLISLFCGNPQEKKINCLITTSSGDIQIELYPDSAPVTVGNFLMYVDNHLYDGSSFFRVTTPKNEANREIKIEVIQGGNVPDEKEFDPIVIETTDQTNLYHTNGVISMARMDPNSATSQFFICIGDQPELDFNGKRNPDGQGFAAFGKVIKGMDVVKRIQSKKEEGQYLVDSVTINSIRRIN